MKLEKSSSQGIAGDIVPHYRQIKSARPPRRSTVPVPKKGPLSSSRGANQEPAAAARQRQLAKPRLKSSWRTKLHWLLAASQYPLIAVAGLAAAYSTTFGQCFVLGYMVVALTGRRRSSFSFGVTLFLLAIVAVFEVLGQKVIAQNVAVYTFELLAFGTVQAIWEQRKIATSAN
ncbi:MAG TPA: hypothetical protein VLI05_01030 [Candidatus Saccharimonadia bacterium]|nr:hypothetical protein [Candidatus Saccharimonadia bacterium]